VFFLYSPCLQIKVLVFHFLAFQVTTLLSLSGPEHGLSFLLPRVINLRTIEDLPFKGGASPPPVLDYSLIFSAFSLGLFFLHDDIRGFLIDVPLSSPCANSLSRFRLPDKQGCLVYRFYTAPHLFGVRLFLTLIVLPAASSADSKNVALFFTHHFFIVFHDLLTCTLPMISSLPLFPKATPPCPKFPLASAEFSVPDFGFLFFGFLSALSYPSTLMILQALLFDTKSQWCVDHIFFP